MRRVRARHPASRAWRGATAACVAALTFACATPNEPEVPVVDAPSDAQVVSLARELVRRGLHDVALVQLERAPDDDAEVQHLRAISLREEGRLEEAEDTFSRLVDADPSHARAHHGLGLTLDQLGRAEDAQSAYLRAIALDPARPAFHNDLGFSRLAAGEPATARKHFERALSLDPDFAPARINLAASLTLLGREDEALRVLSQGRPLAAAMNDLGAVLELRGDTDRARARYRDAVELDPRFAPARRNLARLEPREETP